ncbi:MAG: DmsC/YnfH family molybdoenzyme membrane anchor subunit [Sphingorhabdus sp.]
MHPAKSVIFFTTASGAGYGLMIWLALLANFAALPADFLFGIAALGVGFALIVSGLLSSTLHLGHPERAWRALSQWRSSWLSREGVAAIVTFIPLGIFALSWVFAGHNSGMIGMIGLIGAAMCVVTVYTTSMIYGSLKAIPAWHNRWTVASYLTLSLMSGALLLLLLGALLGMPMLVSHMINPALLLLGLGLAVKLFYWWRISHSSPVSTAESATGLGKFGKVSFAGSPHDQDNYLLKEMGFKIARKHSRKLRILAGALGFVMPFVMIGAASWTAGMLVSLLIVVATLCAAIGLVFERWLFFAEAKHVVTLYYGETEV